jgi:hypothetical protein
MGEETKRKKGRIKKRNRKRGEDMDKETRWKSIGK